MTEDNKIQEIGILRYAMSQEEQGAAFYREQAGRFANDTTVDFFMAMAEMEDDHYRIIKEQLEKYTDSPEDYELEVSILDREEDSIFKDRFQSEDIDLTLAESQTPDITTARMAYLIEKDFKEFYEEAAEMVDHPGVKDLLLTLAKWEQGHEDIFKNEYHRLRKEYMTLPWGG